MGVKDLWKLLECTGRPVSLEQLQGLVLAIDVSVWLHHAAHGARDRTGQPLQSAHLILLFSRICKLLHYQIKPVFVFDGGTPALKQQTLAQRNKRRQSAGKKGQKAEDKQRVKYMQAKILEQLTGKKGSTAVSLSSSQPDLFDLPPLPEDVFNKDRSPVMDVSGTSHLFEDVGMVDTRSQAFVSLPPELQHEILQERQELERHTYTDPGSMPSMANDFSNYQLSKLMQRSKLNRQLEDVRKILKSSETVGVGLTGQSQSCEIEANRIMSSDSAHYILVRGVDVEGSSQDGEQGEEEGVKEVEKDDVMAFRDDVMPISSDEYTCSDTTGLGMVPARQCTLQQPIECKVILESSTASCYESPGACEENVCELGIGAVITPTTALSTVVTISDKCQMDGDTDTRTSGTVDLLQQSGLITATSLEPVVQRSLTTGSMNVSSPQSTVTATSDKPTHPLSVDSHMPSPTKEQYENSHSCSEDETGEKGEYGVIRGTPDPIADGDSSGGGDIGKMYECASEVGDSDETVEGENGASGDVGDTTKTGEGEICEGGDSSEAVASGDVGDVGDTVTTVRGEDGDSGAAGGRWEDGDSGAAGVRGEDGDSGAVGVRGEDGDSSAAGVRGEDGDSGAAGVRGEDGDSGAAGVRWEDGDSGAAGVRGEDGDSGAVGVRGEDGDSGAAGVRWEEGVLQVSPEEAQLRLGEEVGELGRERERQRRAAAGVTSQVHREAQELLSLFGLPYIVAPMEAEAQCAYLDHTHQTHGTVTDDSDVFLFGGQKVYRHFFHQEKCPTFYDANDIKSALGLTRSRMVCLAYLLGSDYTAGLQGVGVVNAMEVIGHFGGEGTEPLRKLKEWHTQINSTPGITIASNFERRLRDLVLPDGFPSQAVWQAYMMPDVDESTEQLQWGTPDLDLIRKYMSAHVGWNQDRVDSVLLPVLKRVNSKQRNITSYFTNTTSSPPLPSTAGIKSNRLRNVVARITNTGDAGVSPKPKRMKKVSKSSSDESSGIASCERRGRGKGRRKGGRGRGGTQKSCWKKEEE